MAENNSTEEIIDFYRRDLENRFSQTESLLKAQLEVHQSNVSREIQEDFFSNIKRWVWVLGILIIISTGGGLLTISSLIDNRINTEMKKSEERFKSFFSDVFSTINKSMSDFHKKYHDIVSDFDSAKEDLKSNSTDIEERVGNFEEIIDSKKEEIGEINDLLKNETIKLWTFTATFYYYNGEYEKALFAYERASEIEKKYMVEQAMVLMNMCKVERANRVIKDYMDSREGLDDAQGHLVRGMINHILGIYDIAHASYHKAQKHKEHYEAAYFNAAVIHAYNYHKTSDEKEFENLTEHLELSIEKGGKERVTIIREGLKLGGIKTTKEKIEDGELENCENHPELDNLSFLKEDDKFIAWLESQEAKHRKHRFPLLRPPGIGKD